MNFDEQNKNFNKNKTESEMENPTHSFREKNLVLRLIQEWQIKKRTLISRSSGKEKESIFCTVYFVRRTRKTLLHTLFCLFFKIVESLQCVLR